MQASAKIRLQLAEQAEIACPGEVFAGQPEKKRGRVDTAVVRRKRQLAGLGQLALTQLVEDLPWLLITQESNLVPCQRASETRQSRAMSDLSASVWSPTIAESRPKSVSYQGVPAAGYPAPVT